MKAGLAQAESCWVYVNPPKNYATHAWHNSIVGWLLGRSSCSSPYNKELCAVTNCVFLIERLTFLYKHWVWPSWTKFVLQNIFLDVHVPAINVGSLSRAQSCKMELQHNYCYWKFKHFDWLLPIWHKQFLTNHNCLILAQCWCHSNFIYTVDPCCEKFSKINFRNCTRRSSCFTRHWVRANPAADQAVALLTEKYFYFELSQI